MTVDPELAGSLTGGRDTIVALATPPGRGAISIVRMSGPDALRIAERVIDPWPLEPRRVTLCRVSDADQGQVLDQALITAFIGPDSFTGENLVEISGHGGHYVPALLVETLISCGARPALAGEFTRRAVLNGKLDMTQAEAIGDLVDARSQAMHRAALGQLDGGLSRRIAVIRSNLISVESLIAYDIDFPEEDDGPISRNRIGMDVEVLLTSLDVLLATVPVGEMIREGAIVVIAGRPNVGKSSLFNALLGQSRAIVTDTPGTTRDAIESFLETKKWPLRLVDTAGLRETINTVERIGIEVSERYLSRANAVLACGDSDESLSATLEALEGRTESPIIRVKTKGDLGRRTASGQLLSSTADVTVSAETGEGLASLMALVDGVLSSKVGAVIADVPILTRSRHIQAIRQARAEVASFGEAWQNEMLPAPVAAVHLRAAATALETLIGAVSADDVLDRVFSSFCVGK
ncbi:MAG: tRNA uridine-5-carboxymethylaminomethyl(34) synthesis GTPase MnmE [Gemmatimonadaceae bacterium]|nr:tRNA uridine-5-carboxymethylaminomethyl(34) synthesis GTPase MnmE [Gemmatimonadaceae bacterium]